jgi:hypothetical protein
LSTGYDSQATAEASPPTEAAEVPRADEDAEVKDEPSNQEQLTKEQLTVIEDGLQAAHEQAERMAPEKHSHLDDVPHCLKKPRFWQW